MILFRSKCFEGSLRPTVVREGGDSDPHGLGNKFFFLSFWLAISYGTVSVVCGCFVQRRREGLGMGRSRGGGSELVSVSDKAIPLYFKRVVSFP